MTDKANNPPTDRAAINRRLALRMGWTRDDNPESFWKAWTAPDGSRHNDPPDYFTDPAASRALVEWLATQDSLIQDRFNAAIERAVAAYGFKATPLQALVCLLEQIALAAASALGETE